MPRKIEISHKTIFFTLGILGLIWFIIQVRDILLLLFVCLILVSALHSPVEALAKRKIPRPASILLFYFLILAVFGGGIALIIPTLVVQTRTLVNNLPVFLETASRLVPYQIPTQEIIGSFSNGSNILGQNIFRYTLGFFGNVITLVTLFVFTFYLLLRWNNLGKFLSAMFGREERYNRLLSRIEVGLGNWVRGEMLLMLIIGLMAYIGLTLLGIPYALPLAIFAGLLEIVPVIGPVVSAIPAIIVTLPISPLLALAVAALYFLIQQLENNLVVPKVMQRAVGLDPLATILALMVGAKLMGTLGAVLAIPLVILIKIVILDLYRGEKKENNSTV